MSYNDSNTNFKELTGSSPNEEEADFLSEFDPQKLFVVFKLSIPFIILIFGLCFGATYFILRYTKPIFRSQSTLKLEQKGTASILKYGLFESEDKVTNYLIGEIEFIRSTTILQKVVDSLSLNVAYFLKGNVTDDEKFESSPFIISQYKVLNYSYYNKAIEVRVIDEKTFSLNYTIDKKNIEKEYLFGQKITTPYFEVVLEKTNFFNDRAFIGEYYFKIYTDNYLLSFLKGNLSVGINNPKAYTIRIVFQDENKYKAASIINAVDSFYLAQAENRQKTSHFKTINYLENQLKSNFTLLADYEKKKDEFKKSNTYIDDILTVKEKINTILKAITDLQTQKIRLKLEIEKYKQITNFIATDTNQVVIERYAAMLGDKKVLERITKLDKLEKEREKLLKSYTENTFAYQEQVRKVTELKTDIITSIAMNKILLVEQIAILDSKIKKQQNSIPSETGKIGIELREIQRYLTSYERNIDLLLGKIVETNVAAAGTESNFYILEMASPGDIPVYPIRNSFYAYALGLAIILSFLLIAIQYLLRNKIANLKDVEKRCAAPTLGAIPHYTKTKMTVSQLVVHQNPKWSISEAFRSIRTNLDFIVDKRKKRVISVTSTTSGEGKTFIALNLAGIIAMSQQRVVVLDLDLRKPKVHRGFGVENTVGISSLLIGKTTLDKAIQHSEIPTLDFITSGPIPPNPSELILSERFDELLEQLKQKYDVVVFDTPPVGLITDGIIAMKKATLPIYVVRAGYSKQNSIQLINRLYSGNQFTKLSVVLNGMGAKGSYAYGDYGGYGYGGYGYGYGYGYYDDDKTRGLWNKIKHKFSSKK